MCCTVRSFKGHADKYVISGAYREVILSDIIATSYIWISDVIENVCQLLHKVLSKIYYFAWSTSCAVLGFKCDTWHIVWSCHDCDAATWIPFAIDVMKCLQFCKKNLYSIWGRWWSHWASYQKRKIAGCACAGNTGNEPGRCRKENKM